MSAEVACVQHNQAVSVKVRLIVSMRYVANAAQSRMMRVVDDVPKGLLWRGGEENGDKGSLGGGEEVRGVEEVGVRKKLAMRLRFTRVSVPTMKEYQHAESLLA